MEGEVATPMSKRNYIRSVSDIEPINLWDLPKIKTNIPELDSRTNGIMYGTVTILTGKRGNGKSTFLSQLICEALDQGVKVFAYSGELTGYHFKAWLDLQLAGFKNLDNVGADEFGQPMYAFKANVQKRINEWYRDSMYIYDNSYVPENESEHYTIKQIIETAIKECECRLICIDNLMTAMDEIKNPNDIYSEQGKFVGAMANLAKKYNVAVILVSHPRKNTMGAADNDDVSGSSQITDRADVVLHYNRNTKPELDCESLLSITKNRFFGKYATDGDAIELMFSDVTKRVVSARYRKEERHYGWEKEETDTDEGGFQQIQLTSDEDECDLPF